MKYWSSFVAALAVFAIPVLAEAQSAPEVSNERESHWGITVNFAPSWTVPENLKILFDANRVNIKGSDFEIGFVRGRDLGGDWGMSLVRKSIKDGSFVERGYTQCFGSFGCALNGSQYYAQGVSLLGVEVHKFVPFVTIKKRAQIGMNFGGGIAKVNGQTEWHDLYHQFVTIPPGGGGRIISVQQGEKVSQAFANQFFMEGLSKIPLAKVEIAAAAILSPGLKVRVSGGLNFPTSYKALNLTVSYLFGVK